ncbi:MAG: S8 family serine peptidase, partial [Eubacterium sp.]|nr:S8 family serine peptidase [Eubacterium sp.]
DVTYVPIDECADELSIEAVETDESTIYCKPYQTKRLIVDCDGSLPEVNSIDSLETPDGSVLLQFDSEAETKNAYEVLNESDNVNSVSGENTYSASAYSASDFPLSENLSWGADYIDSPQAVSYSIENGLNKQVTVAVIDSGVDIDHQYLQGRILSSSKSIIGSSYDDQNGHGTHVSGIIVDNTPDNVKILAVQALNAAGKGSDYQIAAAVNYAVSQKVDIINMSLGGPDLWSNSVLKTAIKNAYDNNITICVAAGNEADNAKYYYPANSSYCITVGALAKNGSPDYDYSNYGSVIDVCAPGSDILSSFPGGDYIEASGTSMATPFVSAACAMKILLSGKVSPSKTKDYIKKNVIPHIDENESQFGTGIISLTKYVPKERTAPVCFNKLGGYYKDDSLSITMSSSDKSAKIYYTTDGSDPSNTNGTLYSKAVTITKNTTFKAVAYYGSKYKSKITKASYIFGQIAKESDFKLVGSTITDYYGPSGDLIVPEKISGKTVTVIGEDVFKNKHLTSVSLPKSVIKISDFAFADNDLEFVEAQSVTYIGNSAFAHNSRLSNTKFGKVNYIGSSAFENCNMSQDSINFSAVTEIGQKAFLNCNFTKITNADKLAKIGASAFENNDFFVLNLPSVKSIGNNAFSGNKNLRTVKLNNADSIGSNAFSYCDLTGSLSLPKVKKISNGAFSHSNVKNVSLPLCTSIGSDVFESCSSLATLSVPKCEYLGSFTNSSPDFKVLDLPSVKEIDSIYDCKYLEVLNIPECYTAASNCQITSCPQLKVLSAPLLTVLPNIADCNSLETINLPNVVDTNNNSVSGLSSLRLLNLSAVSKAPAILNCSSLETVILSSAASLSEIKNCSSLKNLIIPNVKAFNDSLLTGSVNSIDELSLDSAENVTLTLSNNINYSMPKVKNLSSNNTAVLSVAVPQSAKLSKVNSASTVYTANTSISGYNVVSSPSVRNDLPESYVLDDNTEDALSISVFCAKPSYQWQYSKNSSFTSPSNIANNNRNTIIPDKSGYYRCVVTDTENSKKVISSVCNVSCEVKTVQVKFSSSNKAIVLWRNALLANVASEVINIPVGDKISVYDDVNIKTLWKNGSAVADENGFYNIEVSDDTQITSNGRINLSKAKLVNTSNKDKHYGSYYSSGEREPMLKLVYNNKELVKNKDYIVRVISDRAPVLPGTYNFTIIGLGDYYGRFSDEFVIHNASIDDCKFAEIKPQPYTGSFVEPVVKATIDGKAIDTFDVYYVDNVGVGTATATVYGKGYIDGEKDLKFRIGYDISGAKVTLNKNSCYYSEINPCKPKPTVIYQGRTLKENKDYKVSYKNNNAVGTATAVITGMGNYVNSTGVSFKIVKGVPFEPKLSKTSFVYNGGVQRPTVTVKDSKGNALTYKKDFTVNYSNWSSTNVGTYKVTVNFIGKYCGSKTYNYKITAQSKVTPKLNRNTFTANGKTQKPSVTVTDAKGNKLVKNKDFTLSYSNNNSKNVGRYTVTVKMKGNYSGSKTYPYYINPKPTEFLASNKGGFKAVSKGFTLKWNKQNSQTTGYQIQYATRSDFKNAATITIANPNTTSYTIKGRAANTRYYVRIRTYKKIGNGTFYSSWNSGTKSVVTLR